MIYGLVADADPSHNRIQATPAMTEDSLLPFSFPAVDRKKITAAFDGGRITSDAGVVLLGQAERRRGLADKLAAVIADPRNPLLITHPLGSILRTRILAIACGYEDADDLDHLRKDPAFKLACGRLPDTGDDLCSQPTMSRWENAPTLREILKLSGVLIDFYCASYATPPQAVTLDIDDTCDVAHGHQQLSLFNAHYDDRCFLPIHVYDTATGRPVAVILRPGKTPSGKEVRGHLRRIIRRIRTHWPTTKITIRGDSHYGRREVMDWCEDNGLDYVFGLSGNKLLAATVEVQADDIRTRRALEQAPVLRGYTQTNYAAKSWKGVAARLRPHRSNRAGARYSLRRHQHHERIGRAYLRHALLRAWANGKSDQIAQEPAGVGSNFLSCAARQSDAAHPAHRRILVDARSA